MSRLVNAKKWIARHFEPESEPKLDELRDWVLTKNQGIEIGSTLYIKTDALASVVPEPPSGTAPLTADSLLAK